jgi:hypothetical protein
MPIRTAHLPVPLGLGLILLLAACDLPERQPQRASRVEATDVVVVSPRIAGAAEEIVPAAPEEVVARIDAALRRLGLAPVGPVVVGIPIEARSQRISPPAWADCPEVQMRDPFAEALRARPARAGNISSSATVTVRPADGGASSVRVRAAHEAIYLNPFTNNPERRPCRSTGELEGELLAAAAGR